MPRRGVRSAQTGRANLMRVVCSRHAACWTNVWVALFDDARRLCPRQRLHRNAGRPHRHLPAGGERRDPRLISPVTAVVARSVCNVRDQLKTACASLDHEFWPDDVSLCDDTAVDFTRVHGHQQITDLYLLAPAVKHGGTLVTFDQNILLGTVLGATKGHLTLP